VFLEIGEDSLLTVSVNVRPKSSKPLPRGFSPSGDMLIKNKGEKNRGMLTRALADHLKEVAWALFLFFVILGCLYLILGRHAGYETMIWICLGFALIIIGLFVMIILGELLCLGILKVFKFFKPGD
jgi:hypothetical protein